MPTVVSVIVPIRNEARFIESTLRSLLDQDFPAGDFEVLVADGGSTDETVPIIRRLQGEYANLRLFFNPLRISSAARNLAIVCTRNQPPPGLAGVQTEALPRQASNCCIPHLPFAGRCGLMRIPNAPRNRPWTFSVRTDSTSTATISRATGGSWCATSIPVSIPQP